MTGSRCASRLFDRSRRRFTVAAWTVAVVAMSGLASAASSSANVSHAYSGNFGGETSSVVNPYPLAGPSDVAIDQESHDVYVTDPGHHRVEKFDAAGHFLLMFGDDVNETTTGDVCTAISGNQCKEGTSTTAAGGFEDPTSLAVDNYPGGEGDVYVGDASDGLVQKFNSSGELIHTWGTSGQKDGADATNLPIFGSVYGVAVGGGCATPEKNKNGTCSPNASLYVDGGHYADVWEYTQSGTYIKWNYIGLDSFLKVDSMGDIYAISGPVEEAIPVPGEYQDTNPYQVTTETSTTGFDLDFAAKELYQDTGTQIDHYGSSCNPPVTGTCAPLDSFGAKAEELVGPMGVGVDEATHAVYVANSMGNTVSMFSDIRPTVTTGPPKEATETEVTLTGTINPNEHGDITQCRFEYGFSQSYDHSVECSPKIPPSYSGPTEVTARITGLSPGTKDHYRLVATNSGESTAEGADELFYTTQPPAIDGIATENLTATSAELKAAVNPNGLETKYRFEYGPTANYGSAEPVPDGVIAAGNADQTVRFNLTNLVPHVVYHYRLVAENSDGSTESGDQTFNFFPPGCPNENVRQQTQANYLPDCRAYELVSPENAGGTQLAPDGPNTGYATNPSRFSFTGVFSTIPGSGGQPIDGAGDLYVSTRTDTGWVTKYVGWPSSEAAVDGGPALGPPGSIPYQICREPYSESCYRSPSALGAASGFGSKSQNGVFTDPNMDRFLSFNDGNQSIESIFGSDFQNRTVISSDAPYVVSAEGTILDRWPTNLNVVPSGSYPPGSHIAHSGKEYVEAGEEEVKVAPGGTHSLDCPYVAEGNRETADDCSGDVTSSADLSHFVFASEWNEFAPGGLLTAPGSVYDNNTGAQTVTVASKTPSGGDIPGEPTDLAGDPLQIPNVSSNGSHILMAAGGTGPCGHATCETPPCGGDYSMVRRCIMQPSHLYMRVDEATTYDVSQGHDVIYVGATASGSKVYFTSEEHLTGEDAEHVGASLYMWSEQGEQEGDPLTLISKGDNEGKPGEPGNTGDCSAEFNERFTSKCGITTPSQLFLCEIQEVGGNCLSDNFVAAENGDVYFSSPEQLDGSRGIPNQQNLYVYHDGHVQYVTTLAGSPFCFETYSSHMCTRLERIQVSPTDGHMAFITNAQITEYNNNGYQEMYTYEPSTRKLVCVSCIPSGEPPTSNVEASQDGLFMTNDGRTFFSTEDALVHSDTNKGEDVYEYVNGHAQLITLGTGETSSPKGAGLGGFTGSPGLIGVSANGNDVYFSTFATLVPQDHNGLFLKFYDARTDGGFPQPPTGQPCEAAEECHGASSELPPPLENGTSAALGTGGNTSSTADLPPTRRRVRRHRPRLHRRHHRSAHDRPGRRPRGGQG